MGSLIDDERLARVGLARVAEPGDAALARLVDQHGPVEAWVTVCRGDSGLPNQSGYLARLDGLDPSQDLDRLLGCHGRVVIPGDLEWPSQLDDLGLKAPLALFVRGLDLRRCVLRSAAVVGARAATSYGVTVAGELAAGLADRGWAVVSGGAYGIDAAAHRGALAADGVTVAVLACGVDVAYPRGHAALLERVATDGVVVSELPPGCHPTKSRFLTRNRLIAALSRATVVVEAAHRSGALNTAAAARQLHRPVLAVPGPITSPLSSGVHRLLRRFREETVVVTGADDIVEELGPLGSWAPDPVVAATSFDGLPADVAATLEALPVRRPVDVDRLSRTAGLAPATVTAALRRLQLLGLAVVDDHGWRLAEQSGRPDT